MDHGAEEYARLDHHYKKLQTQAPMEQKPTDQNENIIINTNTNIDVSFSNLVSTNIFNNVKRYSHEEYQYLNLLDDILENGTWEEGRNGRVKCVFGRSMRFSLKDGKIPIITTKKTAWKTCLKELLWFIRGETDAKLLQDQGVHIWDGNSSREFLDS